jgi:hypothetical protein
MGKRVLKIFLRAIGLLAALIAVLMVVGLFLPTTYDISVSQHLKVHPSSAYHYLNTPRNWVQWGPWNPDTIPGLRSRYEGPLTGEGARWNWTEPELGDGYLEITEAIPYRRIMYRQDHAGFEDVQHGTILIEEENDGTLVTWSHRGTLGRTPLMRWLMLLLANNALEEDFIDALQGLEAHLLRD